MLCSSVPHDSVVALALVADLIAYGSEVGLPCDNPFCFGV